MDEELKKHLASDPDGLLTYEYIANNISDIDDKLPMLVDNMICVDRNGQFCVSAARYLHAIDPTRYSTAVDKLVESAIDKDRERAYIGAILHDFWGDDYHQRAAELSSTDNNFRRIYKRLFPK